MERFGRGESAKGQLPSLRPTLCQACPRMGSGEEAAGEEKIGKLESDDERMGATLSGRLHGRPASSARVASIAGCVSSAWVSMASRRASPGRPWTAGELHPSQPASSHNAHRSTRGASMADGGSLTAERGRPGGRWVAASAGGGGECRRGEVCGVRMDKGGRGCYGE